MLYSCRNVIVFITEWSRLTLLRRGSSRPWTLGHGPAALETSILSLLRNSEHVQKMDKIPHPVAFPGTERDQTVYDVFRCHFDQLVCGAVQPDLLAVKLYSKGLISETVKNDVTATVGVGASSKAITLMNAVEARMKVDSRPAQVMSELCEVMESEATLRPVSSRIRAALCESGKVLLATDLSQVSDHVFPH